MTGWSDETYTGPNCGALVERALRISGVDAVYGSALPGLRVIEVNETAVANLLAIAHERVHRRPAMVHMGGGVLLRTGVVESGEPVHIESISDIVTLPTVLSRADGPKHVTLAIDPLTVVSEYLLPQPVPATGWVSPSEQVITRIQESDQPVVLAGPGVVREGAQGSLRAFAASASAGVLNTWGAKGLFDWRSRHHLATAGLQEQDFELGGLAESDLIVAVGVDADEAPDERWRIAPAVTVRPSELGPLAEVLDRPYRAIAQTALRTRLGAVTQHGWTDHGTPLPPTRVTLHYSQSLGEGGFVAADAGLAGYWVARTFSTTRLGTTSVAAQSHAGLAAASVIVARLGRPWLPGLAVVDGPADEETGAVLEAAARLGVGVGVEAWDPDGPALNATEHLERLQELTLTDAQRVESLRTDGRQLPQMVEAAGRIVAWPGCISG
jgi:hypothetical protein